MSKKVNLGGDRLGSGAKMDVHLHGYSRSTHDLSNIWRSTMAAGTLVPFLKQVALPGDTFDIKLNADVKTLPTVGPLFGSFKMQMDIFQVPIRLYNAGLHMNRLNIGLDMSKVKFPVMWLNTNSLNDNINIPVEFRQLNQSCLLSYLGIRGNGVSTHVNDNVTRSWNAVPLLAYWDIYKNYYANKQEGIGAYLTSGVIDAEEIVFKVNNVVKESGINSQFGPNDVLVIESSFNNADDFGASVRIGTTTSFEYSPYWYRAFKTINSESIGNGRYRITLTDCRYIDYFIATITVKSVELNKRVGVRTFPLTNIDDIRDMIMKQSFNSAFALNYTNTNYNDDFPYSDILYYNNTTKTGYNTSSMNGLGLKTYQSDIFNNWLNTESIDGDNGISAVTAIDTSSGKFTIDTLNLSKKVYDMLNRVAVSGGSYEDWLSATYDHQPQRRTESPVYLGGLSKEVIFQEVVSQSNVDFNGNHPLGSLAGRGNLSQKHKGGYIVAKVDEPSYIIGIVSLTPRIDYSQGNDWDMKLNNLNELHKPALDEIGFQDLLTDQMAFWERQGTNSNPIYFSAGKQPAWLNYMTNYNKTYGNFANSDDQMFMTLNRRYEMDENYRIKDLTTYIDPQKFNYIFADTQRDAQNF